MEPGRTILDAAKLAGKEIPTLCHHPAIPPAGACRICVVEIVAGDRPGLVPACAYPAKDEMDIQTRSERVLQSRRMTLQLMLARSPGSEVIREMAREHGIKELLFPEQNGERGDDCIMCGLCVRLCQQIVDIL